LPFKALLAALFLLLISQSSYIGGLDHDISYAEPQTAKTQASRVEVIAKPKSGIGPFTVHFEPKIANLIEPLKFKWLFGDGKEETQRTPAPHDYDYGKFNVILEVVDAKGNTYTASVTIEASSPGG
jgi:PKD repeat protein